MAVGQLAGISQYAAKPRKWSTRTRSARASSCFMRAIHQAKPSRAMAAQSYSGLPQRWPVAEK
jgi:hypothetical protein